MSRPVTIALTFAGAAFILVSFLWAVFAPWGPK